MWLREVKGAAPAVGQQAGRDDHLPDLAVPGCRHTPPLTRDARSKTGAFRLAQQFLHRRNLLLLGYRQRRWLRPDAVFRVLVTWARVPTFSGHPDCRDYYESHAAGAIAGHGQAGFDRDPPDAEIDKQHWRWRTS
jgi:hypothetical protein